MAILSEAELNRIREQVLDSNPQEQQKGQEYLALAGPVLADLARAGIAVKAIGDLRHLGRTWASSLPILIAWLPKVEDPVLKEEIVRCLSVPWVKTQATSELIREFKLYAPMLKEIPNPWQGGRLLELPSATKRLAPFFSLAWAIGNALSIVGYKGFEDDLLGLATDKQYGAARQMVVEGFGRISSPRVEQALIELLDDEHVKVQAIRALKKLKAKSALSALSAHLQDPSAVIRREASKAVRAIET